MTDKALRTPAALIDAGLAPAEELRALEAVAARYAMAIPPAIAALIEPADPNDPIARQFIPSPAELTAGPGESADPIGDDAHSPVEGIVHRYPDRVLLKLVHVCPVYCRFCFRRAMVGPRGRPSLSRAQLDAARPGIAGPSWTARTAAATSASVAGSRSASAVTGRPGTKRVTRQSSPARKAATSGATPTDAAAAVAARMVPLALGSQTVGSVLRPAAYCGVVGLKPTHGRIGAAGVLELAGSLDHVGVLARAVEDCALALAVLAAIALLAPAWPGARLSATYPAN